ncbi:proton-conducting transporter membrane subunit [Oscillibacter sp.]|uniref:complex I subunit 5 family protein n=1 Tax=Oscillibacter sp. TaxID=1945593 RepID=UPI00289631CC|nr:proton-conducting transporter membrane subunit [Oscillibacter sp.]
MSSFLLLFLVFFPFLAAYFVYPMRRRGREYRNLYVRVIPGVEIFAALLLLFAPGRAVLPQLCGLGLRFEAGSLHTTMAVLAAFLWLMTALPSKEYFADREGVNRYYCAWMVTLGALMGVFLAADFFTLFIFFEIMSFASYVWVAQNENPNALRAGQTYLAVAVFGGMMLLVGLLMLDHLLGSLVFQELPALVAAMEDGRRGELLAAGLFCLMGFGAKAGMVPLHIWLPKAHPVAPAPASALLSGILTKSGIFGILIISRYLLSSSAEWNGVLLLSGAVTMVLGAVLALFSVNLKRALACSSMSQIGFILIGVAMQGYLGEDNVLAAWGTVLHMMNHGLIKLVLFVSAGVIYLATHALDLNELRGWGRNKPALKAIFFVGAAAIVGVPGTSGYISKTLLHESIVEYIHHLEHIGNSAAGFRTVEWLFLISGGLTAAYMTKLFAAIFLEKRAEKQRFSAREYMAPATGLAVGLTACLLVVFGLTPWVSMQVIAERSSVFLRAGESHGIFRYFSWVNLQGALISLGIGAVVYLLIVRLALCKRTAEGTIYLERWPRGLDLEELVYRPAVKGLAFFGAMCARTAAGLGDFLVVMGEKLLYLKAPGIFVPKKNENFGVYARKPKRFLIGETFAFDLTLAGIGLVGALTYIFFTG